MRKLHSANPRYYDDPLRPGYNNKGELWMAKPSRVKRYMSGKVIPFLRLKPGAVCIDMGETNPRMEYMKSQLSRIQIDQCTVNDFNFDRVNTDTKYDAVFAFDIFEHIQNGLFFMSQMKELIKDDGSIYINVPENPRWLWARKHYFEMKHLRFEKWIVVPLGLKIVRQKRIIFFADWRAMFIGIRPLIKVIQGKYDLIEIFRNIFCIQFRIYELRKD